MAPAGGPRDTADSRLHRLKGPHRLEAWRSGTKLATTLETKPGTKPGTTRLGTKLGTKLTASTRPQDTQQPACPTLPLPNLHIRKGCALCRRPRKSVALQLGSNSSRHRSVSPHCCHVCAYVRMCARMCAYGGRFGRLRTIRTRISKKDPCRQAKHYFFGLKLPRDLHGG